jgi:cation:H+ antiporter
MVLVLISSLLLVNSLEWLGNHLKLGSSFVGAILSPLFTSLPELIVILIAIFSTNSNVGDEIGIGTIFGEPFMVSSLSYGILGFAVFAGYLVKKRTGSTLKIDKTLALPLIFIIILFPLTLIPGFINIPWLRYAFGVFFLAAFVFYIRIMYHSRMAELIEESEEIIFARWLPESSSFQRGALAAQVIASITLLYFGSDLLVSSVGKVSQGININPLGLAVIIVPAATAIPETINALIWGYRGKDTLSVGSLVGEIILYSSFYPALGLFLTAWVLDSHAIFSIIVTTLVSLILLYFILKGKLSWYGLSIGIIFFVAYAILVFLVKM